VLIVVEDGDLHRLPQSFLDVEAVGRANVLEIDAADCRFEELAEADYVVGILGAHLEIEDVEISELLEEISFAFHHRLAGERADVSKSEDSGAVSDYSNEVALGRIPVGILRVGFDLEAGKRYSRRVGECEIALIIERLGGDYRDFAGSSRRVVVEGIFTLHGTWKNAMCTIQVLPF
jgi:hypothetical protein